MTGKALTISSDRIRPSYTARSQYYLTEPLRRSFDHLSIRQRFLIFLAVVATFAGAFFVVSQVFGSNKTNENLNASNSSNASSNQQPIKETTNKPMTTNKPTDSNASSSSSSASNSSSTSVTVNGQSVDVPQSGSYDKTLNVSGSTVHVSGNSSQSTTGGSATNSSSTNVEINSE